MKIEDTELEPADVVVVVVAHVPQQGIEAFRAYERAVLALLADHGGKLERRLCSEDGGVEVHLLSFPSHDALARYRADQRRECHQALREASGAHFEVLELRDAAIGELLS